MGNNLIQFVPKDAAQIVLILFLSFLIGLEREEQKRTSEQYRFGGVRPFPCSACSATHSVCFQREIFLAAVGPAVVGAFLWQSYRHKLEGVALAGVTTELSGLVTYWSEKYWVTVTLTVLGVALLELKTALESLAKRTPGDDTPDVWHVWLQSFPDMVRRRRSKRHLVW